MFTSVRQWAGRCLLWGSVIIAGSESLCGQTIIHQETFNTDGDGTRYFIGGRGSGEFADGPAAWDHNFNVSAIGLAQNSPAKRAAILWSEQPDPSIYTDEAYSIFMNLVKWAVNSKPKARVGIYASTTPPSASEIDFRLAGAGYDVSILDLSSGLPSPNSLDLIIQTNETALNPATLFTNYAVPIITFAAPNHDDLLISSIGQPVTIDPSEIKVNPAKAGHAVLGGKTGTIPWTIEPTLLQGIGRSVPPAAEVLATYTVDGTEYPAIVILDKGKDLLGVFKPEPEGAGYILGGDLNAAFGGGATDTSPRSVRLKPVNVAGKKDLKLTLSLAATNVDFEPPDFLRVSIDPNNNGNLVKLTDFLPANAALTNGAVTLQPGKFQDVSFDIPDGATDLVVFIEAFNTFPNEIVAIDNIRITSGLVAALCGDIDLDGDVDSSDILGFLSNWTGDAPGGSKKFGDGDCDLDGDVDSADLLGFLTAWTGSKSAEVVRSNSALVPEPGSISLLALGLLGVVAPARRRR